MSTQHSTYTFELVNPAGSIIADLSGIALDRRFTVRRNRAEQVSFTCKLATVVDVARRLNLSFSQFFGIGINEIWVRRGSRYLVGAKILYVRPQLSSEDATVEVRAWGFLELLGHRFVQAPSRTFTNTDLSDVAWGFINDTQSLTNGDFGITAGALQGSRTITDTWQAYATSVKDILIGLTQRKNGIDFEFTYNKVFNTYYPGIGTDKTELRFSYPGNIMGLALPFDATELGNVVYARGSGNGDVQLIETRTDAASGAVYARYERVDDFPSVSVPTTLDDYGDESLRLYSNPTAIPDVKLDGTQEPYLGAYWIGDLVQFDVAAYAGFDALNGQKLRINEIDVQVGNEDQEAITLKVGYS